MAGADLLASRLVRRSSGEYRMLFACLDESGPLAGALREDGFDVHDLSRRPGVDWRCARRLAGLIRRRRVDVVHPHPNGPVFDSAASRLFGAGAPIVLTEHGSEVPDNTGRSLRSLDLTQVEC